MRREATAFALDFDSPEIVSEVYAEPLPEDGDGEFEDHEDDDTLFMIEQEFCFMRPEGTHLYLKDSLRCCACGTAHPSIRNTCGQR